MMIFYSIYEMSNRGIFCYMTKFCKAKSHKLIIGKFSLTLKGCNTNVRI